MYKRNKVSRKDYAGCSYDRVPGGKGGAGEFKIIQVLLNPDQNIHPWAETSFV